MTSVFQKVPGDGNTNSSPSTARKTINPAIRWCFTLSNYTDEEYGSICSTISAKCRMGIVSKEIAPTTLTPHLQGYIEFKIKSRPVGAFGIPRIHWEKAKGNKQQNILYCSKEDKNPFMVGHKIAKPVKIIKDEQLFDWQKDIIKVIDQDPDDRTIHWYWSYSGSVGKTCFCKYLYKTRSCAVLNGKGADVRNGIVEYHKAHGDTPNLIVYPIPRCHSNEYVSYEALENIKDMFFYSGKYEGGMICGNSPHLIVFANEPPKTEKMSNKETGGNRWNIVCIDPENKPKDNPPDWETVSSAESDQSL